MPIVNENKNTYLQTRAPSKAFPKIQKMKTLEKHPQINRTEIIFPIVNPCEIHDFFETYHQYQALIYQVSISPILLFKPLFYIP
jgi:hypothetical protein